MLRDSYEGFSYYHKYKHTEDTKRQWPGPGTREVPSDMGKSFFAARIGLLSTGTECPGTLWAFCPFMERLKIYPDANTRNMPQGTLLQQGGWNRRPPAAPSNTAHSAIPCAVWKSVHNFGFMVAHNRRVSAPNTLLGHLGVRVPKNFLSKLIQAASVICLFLLLIAEAARHSQAVNCNITNKLVGSRRVYEPGLDHTLWSSLPFGIINTNSPSLQGFPLCKYWYKMLFIRANTSKKRL